jgi:hypothetical protein
VTARTPSTGGTRTGRRSAILLLVLAAQALVVLAAAPAAAIDDASQPHARVTHGPSCRPGGVVVEVTGGTVPFAVTLATTRAPDGEDSTEVRPGETVVLRTGEVGWGETIDPWVEYATLEGPAEHSVDDLEGYTFTRPAEADCAAITAPAAPASVPFEPPAADVEPPVADQEAVPIAPGDAQPGAVPADARVPGADGKAVTPASDGAAARTPSAVDVVADAAPVALARSAPVLPLFAAAVALGAAIAGLATVVPWRAVLRRPPGSA